MMVPDYISPVVGYRIWQWDAAGLKSLNGEQWVPGRRLSALCRADARGFISGLPRFTHDSNQLPHPSCTCGIYAAKTLERLQECGYSRFGFYGEVYLWGTVVEHERGWRAQYAYPKTFVLALHALPFSLSQINARLRNLAAFGTDIFILCDHERVRLWTNGSTLPPWLSDGVATVRQNRHLMRAGVWLFPTLAATAVTEQTQGMRKWAGGAERILVAADTEGLREGEVNPSAQ